MSVEHGPDWSVFANRIETVLSDLEAAARAALAQNRYRPGIAALAAEVANLQAALADVARRQIAVGAIWDDGFQYGQQAPRIPEQGKRPRRHLTLIPKPDDQKS
jgi:hypothetical protein